jgi:hypothetical protein
MGRMDAEKTARFARYKGPIQALPFVPRPPR